MGGQGRGLLAARLQRGATGRQAAEFAVQAQLQALVLHALAFGQHLLGGLQRSDALALGVQSGQCGLDLGHAVEHALAVGLDGGLQRQLAGVGLGTAAAPVEQGNVDLRPEGGCVVLRGTQVLGDVERVQQRAADHEARIQRRMRNALLGRRALHGGLRHLDVGARAQQVGRQDGHAQRLGAGQRGLGIGLQPLRIGPRAAQQGGQHVGAAGLGFAQAGTQGAALAGLQLQLVHGLCRAQALLLAHLGQLQGTRIQQCLFVDQGALALRHADVQIAVDHIGHQGHAGCLQAAPCVKHGGGGIALAGLAGAEQAQVPAHVDAGVEIRVDGRNVLQRARTGREHGPEGRAGRAGQQPLLAQARLGLGQVEVGG